MKQQKQINKPFLFTDNKETAKELLMLGYPLLSSTNIIYTFLNVNIKNFSREEMSNKNLIYSDRMCFEGYMEGR